MIHDERRFLSGVGAAHQGDQVRRFAEGMMDIRAVLTRFRAARNHKRTIVIDIHTGEGLFLVRAAQVARMKANQHNSCLAMFHGFNPLAGSPYAKSVGFW
jgi:hypothetical protein